MDGEAVATRFGRNVWRCRRRAGLRQQDVADVAELHRADISALERGERQPRLDTLLRVSAALSASPCVLLAGLRWQPGRYVEGGFRVDDGSGWADGLVS